MPLDPGAPTTNSLLKRLSDTRSGFRVCSGIWLNVSTLIGFFDLGVK